MLWLRRITAVLMTVLLLQNSFIVPVQQKSAISPTLFTTEAIIPRFLSGPWYFNRVRASVFEAVRAIQVNLSPEDKTVLTWTVRFAVPLLLFIFDSQVPWYAHLAGQLILGVVHRLEERELSVLDTVLGLHTSEKGGGWTAEEIKQAGGFSEELKTISAILQRLINQRLLSARNFFHKRYYSLPPVHTDLLWDGVEVYSLPTTERFASHQVFSIVDFSLQDGVDEEIRKIGLEKEALRVRRQSVAALIVEEMLEAYNFLRSSGYEPAPLFSPQPKTSAKWPSKRSRSVAEILEYLKVVRHGEVVLNSPERLMRGLQWLDLKGFPLRFLGGLWYIPVSNTSNLGLFYWPSWPTPQREQWDKLLDVETPEAAGKRMKILLFIMNENIDMLDKTRQSLLKSWLGGRSSSGDDRFDQGLEAFAQAFGAEPIFLRTGRSRTFHVATLSRKAVRGMTVGSRVRLYREITGKSRFTLSTETGVDIHALKLLEEGATNPLKDVAKIPVFASALNVSPFEILVGKTESEVLTESMPDEDRLQILRSAAGLKSEQAASRLGIAQLSSWRETGVSRLSPVDLWRALKGEVSPNELAALKGDQNSRRFNKRETSLLEKIASDPLFSLAEQGQLSVATGKGPLGPSSSQVGTRLTTLTNWGIITLSDPQMRRDRTYRLTEFGRKVLSDLKNKEILGMLLILSLLVPTSWTAPADVTFLMGRHRVESLQIGGSAGQKIQPISSASPMSNERFLRPRHDQHARQRQQAA